MRIGIDAYDVNVERKAWAKTYVTNLLLNLAKIDTDNDYLLYLPRPLRKDFPIRQENFKYRILCSPKLWTIWTQVRIPLDLMFQKPDILFLPSHSLPRYHPCKTVVTIHDLAFLTFPAYFKAKDRIIQRKITSYAIKNADRIIAVSHSTKRDIIKYYHVNSEKITVIYHGGGEIRRPISDSDKIEEVRQKYNLPTRYILYLGVLQPRKNLARLIKAFDSLLKDQKIAQGLVIAGKKGWLYQDIFDTVKRLKLQDKVSFTGYIPTNDLPMLLAGADLFVLPSLYEGFGLPVLEAMACGTPVITSNVSSLPEVVGNAAILIDPYNIKEMADAIYRVLHNENLKSEMVRKGLKQAKKFSWEKTARKTLEIYKEVARE